MCRVSRKVGKVIEGWRVLDTETRYRKNGVGYTVYLCECVECGKPRKMSRKPEFKQRCCTCYPGYARVTHGLSRNRDPITKRLAGIVHSAIRRCDPVTGHPDYGLRGIRVCDEFLDKPTFIAYLKTLPGYDDPALSIDRIRVNRGYEPGNLQWATSRQQFYNRRGCGGVVHEQYGLMQGG